MGGSNSINSKQELHATSHGGSTGAHTQASTMEAHQEIVRDALHKCETAAKDSGLEMSQFEIVQEVQWCTNSAPVWNGYSSATGALGHIPRDPLNTDLITSTMVHDGKFNFMAS